MTSTRTQHPAAYRIFHYYYQCEIPQHFLYSQEYVQTFGLPTTGQPDVDRELSQSMVPAQLTIAQMAEAYDDGANIVIIDPNEAVTIYQTIFEHLEDWRRNVISGLSGLEPPIEDLRKLDALAAEVYKVAKSYLPKPETTTGLTGALRDFQRRSISQRLPKEPPETKRSEIKEHKSISDIIAQETFNRGQRWR